MALSWLISPASAAEPLLEVSAPDVVAFYVNWDEASRFSLKENLAEIDVLVPEWLHLADADGNLVLDDVARIEEAIEFIGDSKPDLRILPLVNNYISGAWQVDWLNELLVVEDARAGLTEALVSHIEDLEVEGVTVGLQGLRPETVEPFMAFAAELFAAFHDRGLQVYYTLPMLDRTVDARRLSEVADAIIVLGDGEGWGRVGSGPLASQAWFEAGIARRVDEIPPGKLIVSLSNLARDWSGEKVESYSVQEGYSRARDAAAQVTLDPEKQNARFDYIDEDGVFHAVWMLDAVSAFNQWQSVKHFSPRGVALWRLGTEDPSVWRLLANPLDASAESLQEIKFSHQIDRYGVGEVTRLTGMPQNGLRRIELSTDGTRIVSESIDQFPRSFEINQWGGDDRKLLALTFDDGPDRVFTPAILDILQLHEVPATFFMVGNQMLRHPDLLLRAVAEGHDIGSHTYSHANISRIGADLLRLELNATQRVFESITGRNLVMFRAPYARDTNPSTVEEIRPLKIISDLGYLAVNMNIDSRDWWMPNSRRIADTTLKGIRSGVGNIILLHDGGGDRRHTVDALAEIITTAKAEGYRFVTVSELIGRSRDDVMPPTSSTPTVLALQSAGFGMVREIGVSFSIAFSVAVALGIFRSFVLIVLSSLRHRRQQVSPLVRKLLKLPPPPALSVGVIVPGYNEEKVIVQTVRSLLASTLPKLKILVVDDGSTDGTYELCRTTFKKEKRVRVVTKKNGGKSAALNFGFRRLRTDIIIAMDADTIFLPETAELLLSHFADPQVAAVSGNAKVGNRVNLLTRWQALEYITSQSLDRRAFEYLNCIAVVPGAIGAWRRDLVLAAGGFTTDTLAEDADLTLRLLRRGYSVSYEDRAIALTEAPETVAQFSKQRFRWMYGTLQVAFKHLGALGLRDSKTVGLVALPNTLIFQVLFPLLAPLADLGAIVSIVGLGWDFLSNSTSLPVSEALAFLAVFFAFVLIDFVAAVTSFCHEPKEDWRLLIWIIPQRFFYRQLIYLVAIRAVLSAIRGAPVGWGTLSRTANVKSSAVVPATASKASAART